MRPFFKFFLLSLGLTSGFAAGNVRPGVIGVSLIQLIAAPQEHAGKPVRVIGFVKIGFEHNAIYLHREDLDHGLSKNGLWLETSRPMMQELIKLSGSYVLIEGVFDPDNRGHGGLFSGALTDISRVDVWRSR
jgi:hypothetical protein